MPDEEIGCLDVIAQRLDLAGELQSCARKVALHDGELLSYSYARTARFLGIVLYRSASFQDVDIARYGILTQYDDGIAIRGDREILQFYVHVTCAGVCEHIRVFKGNGLLPVNDSFVFHLSSFIHEEF